MCILKHNFVHSLHANMSRGALGNLANHYAVDGLIKLSQLFVSITWSGLDKLTYSTNPASLSHPLITSKSILVRFDCHRSSADRTLDRAGGPKRRRSVRSLNTPHIPPITLPHLPPLLACNSGVRCATSSPFARGGSPIFATHHLHSLGMDVVNVHPTTVAHVTPSPSQCLFSPLRLQRQRLPTWLRNPCSRQGRKRRRVPSTQGSHSVQVVGLFIRSTHPPTYVSCRAFFFSCGLLFTHLRIPCTHTDSSKRCCVSKTRRCRFPFMRSILE